VLGSGFFGIVCMGKVKGMPVAVKTVKPNTKRDVLLSLLAEIKIMSHLQSHPNIVELIGANTDGLANGTNNYEYVNTNFKEPYTLPFFCHKVKHTFSSSSVLWAV
jgi:serine/threonine protein kinase